MYMTMSGPQNSKALLEISRLNTQQLIEVLKSNGVDDDCCTAIENYQIDGEEFLKLSEVQIKLWRPPINRAQITRLWSIIQLARERPKDFYSSSSITSRQTLPSAPSTAPFKPPLMARKPSNPTIRPTGPAQYRPENPVLHKPPMQLKTPWENPKPDPQNTYDTPKSISIQSDQFNVPPNPQRSPWQQPKPGFVGTNVAPNNQLDQKVPTNQPGTAPIQQRSPVSQPKGFYPPQKQEMQTSSCIRPPTGPPSSLFGPKPQNVQKFNNSNTQPSHTKPHEQLSGQLKPPSGLIPPKSPEVVSKFIKNSSSQPTQEQPVSNSSQLKPPMVTPSGSIPPKSPELISKFVNNSDSQSRPPPADQNVTTQKKSSFLYSLNSILSLKQNAPKKSLTDSDEDTPAVPPFPNSWRKPSNVSNTASNISYESESFSDSFDSDDESTEQSNNDTSSLTQNTELSKSTSSSLFSLTDETSEPKTVPQSRRRTPLFVNRPLPPLPGATSNPEPEHYKTPSNAPVRPPPEPPRKTSDVQRPVLMLPKPPTPIVILPDMSPEVSPAPVDEEYYEPDFTDFTREPWYYAIDRIEARKMLANKPNGSFIIRPSDKQLCTLVITYNNKLYNLALSGESGSIIVGTVSEDKKKFSSVKEVVDFYTQNNLPLIFNGSQVYVKLCHFQ